MNTVLWPVYVFSSTRLALIASDLIHQLTRAQFQPLLNVTSWILILAFQNENSDVTNKQFLWLNPIQESLLKIFILRASSVWVVKVNLLDLREHYGVCQRDKDPGEHGEYRRRRNHSRDAVILKQRDRDETANRSTCAAPCTAVSG